MIQWEYKLVNFDSAEGYTASSLSDFGNDGWELVSVLGDLLTFKRPRPIATEAIPCDPPEVEYITPTAEHVGQMVEVWDRHLANSTIRELAAIVSDGDETSFICRSGSHASEWVSWKQARVAVKR